MEYKYFSTAGDPLIRCQCGCGLGLTEMSAQFMRRLDIARERAGVTFTITSGIRCPVHNNNVSTTGYDGPHTTGYAVDIATPNPRARLKIRRALIQEGFHRFGSHPLFIHVDDSAMHDPDVEWWY